MESFSSRLEQFISSVNMNTAEFERECKLSKASVQRVLADRSKVLVLDSLLQIKNRFRTLNLEWLITGNGNMLHKYSQVDELRRAKEAENSESFDGDFLKNLDLNQAEKFSLVSHKTMIAREGVEERFKELEIDRDTWKSEAIMYSKKLIESQEKAFTLLQEKGKLEAEIRVLQTRLAELENRKAS